MSAFGNILGIRATLMLGPGNVPLPAPLQAMEAIQEIEVRQSSYRASGFKLALSAGRNGPLGLLGPPFVGDPRFEPGARIRLTVWNGIKPTVIFDGKVTKAQYIPGSGANEGRYVLLGRDLSHELDQDEKRVAHPAQDETVIANKIAGSYAQLGLIPMVIPPSVLNPSIPLVSIPQQSCTDWQYLKALAKRHGYKVFIDPGPVPGVSTLYFGPLPKPDAPQKPITVNMGPMSDAYDVTVEHDGETLTAARAKVQDSATGDVTELQMPMSTTTPASAMPASVLKAGQVREMTTTTSGLNIAQVMAKLMAMVNESAESVVKVHGKIDNARYNGVLKPYRNVAIRGLGMLYNGDYRVAEVRHALRPGQYTQSFELHRDGLMPLVPMVTPEVAPT